MSRLSVLVHRPRRTLAALATVLVAVGITAASGADFTATSANADTTFATGTLSILNSNAGQAVLSGTANMRPGDAARTGTIDIKNSGSLSGDFKLSRGAVVDSDPVYKLSTQLNLVIKDCGLFTGATPPPCTGATQKYSGTVADLTSDLDLGNYAAGAQHRYEFSVDVNGASNNYQGKNSIVPFTWTAA
jgi:hypothetical protein